MIRRSTLMASVSVLPLAIPSQRLEPFDGWYGAIDDGYHVIDDDEPPRDGWYGDHYTEYKRAPRRFL